MASVTITKAQMAALEAAGIFECPDENHPPLILAIAGHKITVDENRDLIARIVCDISNDCDELARCLNGDAAKWARADSRALTNLYSKILRA